MRINLLLSVILIATLPIGIINCGPSGAKLVEKADLSLTIEPNSLVFMPSLNLPPMNFESVHSTCENNKWRKLAVRYRFSGENRLKTRVITFVFTMHKNTFFDNFGYKNLRITDVIFDTNQFSTILSRSKNTQMSLSASGNEAELSINSDELLVELGTSRGGGVETTYYLKLAFQARFNMDLGKLKSTCIAPNP